MSTYTSCCLACRLSQCLSVGWLLAASMHLLRRIATYKVYPQHYDVFNINIWIQQSILTSKSFVSPFDEGFLEKACIISVVYFRVNIRCS